MCQLRPGSVRDADIGLVEVRSGIMPTRSPVSESLSVEEPLLSLAVAKFQLGSVDFGVGQARGTGRIDTSR